MKKTIIINNLDEMDALANHIALFLRPGQVIGLSGDLGSGKTTFTKFLGRHMGIADTIHSPTFNIIQVYENPLPLYHIDAYRLEDIGYDYELDDFIFGDGVAVIEWYPFIETMLPEDMLTLDIQLEGGTKRRVTIEGSGQYEEIIENLGH